MSQGELIHSFRKSDQRWSPRKWISRSSSPVSRAALGRPGPSRRLVGQGPRVAQGGSAALVAQAQVRDALQERAERVERVPPAPARRAQRREQALLEHVFGVEHPGQVTSETRPDAAQERPAAVLGLPLERRLFRQQHPSPLRAPPQDGPGAPQTGAPRNWGTQAAHAGRIVLSAGPSGAGRRFSAKRPDRPRSAGDGLNGALLPFGRGPVRGLHPGPGTADARGR